MPEYTPTTEEVRTTYAVALFAREHGPDEHVHDSVSDGDAEFDRWLAQVKAEAAAQALEDWAADRRRAIQGMGRGDEPGEYWEGADDAADTLLRHAESRAATYRKGQTDAD